MEPSLLDLIPAARQSGPDTSRDAAVAILPARNLWMSRCLAAIVQLERRGHDGATVHEVAERLSCLPGRLPAENSLARRISDLHERGFVVDSTRRRPGGTGRPQIVWRSTADGRDALG